MAKERSTEEIILGGIYEHCRNERELYQVLAQYPSATGYEEGQQVSETIIYEQLYAGSYPKGTIWTRDKKDFLGFVEIDGDVTPKFKLVNTFTLLNKQLPQSLFSSTTES